MMADTKEKNKQHEILVVDDTPASLALLTHILTNHGYRVRPASSGLLALRSVAVRIPDLILLDVKMPDMDGFEVCRRLKSDERTRGIPVLFISARGETTEKVRGFEAGGIDYITKPFETDEVLARVKIHLQLSDLTEHLEQKVHERTEELTATNLKLQQEIIEHKQAEEMIKHQAYHDLLTGLPNRAQLILRFDIELAQANRNRKKLAVLHFDLDRFKIINDSLGHFVGDQVIRAVGERLKTLIRMSDTLSRIGDDEFIILLADINRAEDAARFAQKVTDAMRKVFRIGQHEIYLTTSIGISIFPEDSNQADVLLTNADIAVSHVKKQRRDSYEFFNSTLNVRTIERLRLENGLRLSIERGELLLLYQPLINIRTGKICCLEALVRWKHAVLGVLPPSQFIPIAEEIGFITSIDEWVLRTACTQVKAWFDEGLPPFIITVNLSTQQFQQPRLIEMITKIIHETNLNPYCLGIEVTESTAMRDIELAIPNLYGLHDMGIKLSIDDFGTGHSSLSYLKRFPVQTLKIDQSFIKGVATDPDDQAIVRAVIAMGHNLQMKIIAEGVETDKQLAFLRDNDCDEVQGFLFSQPRTAEEICELIAQKK
jgi:diguanylate cyclase (GGDEF)-like protein